MEEESKRPRISKSDESSAYYENIPRLLELDAHVSEKWQASGKKAQCCNYGCPTHEFWKYFESVKVWIDYEADKCEGEDTFVCYLQRFL